MRKSKGRDFFKLGYPVGVFSEKMENIFKPPPIFGPLKFLRKIFRPLPENKEIIRVNLGKFRKIFAPPQIFAEIFAPLKYFAKIFAPPKNTPTRYPDLKKTRPYISRPRYTRFATHTFLKRNLRPGIALQFLKSFPFWSPKSFLAFSQF